MLEARCPPVFQFTPGHRRQAFACPRCGTSVRPTARCSTPSCLGKTGVQAARPRRTSWCVMRKHPRPPGSVFVQHAACARAVAGIAGMPLRRCWLSWHAPAPLPPGRRNHPHQQHDNYRRGLPMRFGVDARRSSAAHNYIMCDRTPGVAASISVGAFLCFARNNDIA